MNGNLNCNSIIMKTVRGIATFMHSSCANNTVVQKIGDFFHIQFGLLFIGTLLWDQNKSVACDSHNFLFL